MHDAAPSRLLRARTLAKTPQNEVKLAKKLLHSKRATQQEALKEYKQDNHMQSAVKKLKERNELRGTPIITQI